MPANIEVPPYDTNGRGTPVTGMMPRHIPMFWKAWKPNQQAMPAAASRPKTSSVRAAIASARQMTMPSSAISRPAPTRPSSSPATVKTKSVCCSGTKPGAGLRAVEEPLAEEAAVADRDPGLLDVVAGAARVEVGVGEGQEAVDLVLLEEAAARPRRPRPRRRRRRAAPASAAALRRAATTPEHGGGEHQHGAEVGLEQDQHGGHGGDREHDDARRPSCRPAAPRPAPRRARRPTAPSR